MKKIKNLWCTIRKLVQEPRYHKMMLVLMFSLSIFVVFFVIFRDWENIINYKWEFDGFYLIMSSLFYAVSLILSVFCWSFLMYGLNVEIAWKKNARFYMYSWMARRLPTAAPFVASRVMLYEQEGISPRQTLTGMFWEQFLLFASGSLLVILISPFTIHINNKIPLIPVMVLSVISLILVLQPSIFVNISNWFLRKIKKEPISKTPNVLITLIVLFTYMIIWVTGGMVFFLMIRSIYFVEWNSFLVICQIWIITGLVGYIGFIIPVSLGLNEISKTVLLLLIVPLSVALIIVVMMRVWIAIQELFWSVILLKS